MENTEQIRFEWRVIEQLGMGDVFLPKYVGDYGKHATNGLYGALS